MPDPLSNQNFAFPANPTPIFVTRIWRSDHRTYAWLAALEREQCARQSLSIDLVGLSTPTSTGSRDRSCVDDVTLDAVSLQHAVYPEAVEARLLDDDQRVLLACPLPRLRL